MEYRPIIWQSRVKRLLESEPLERVSAKTRLALASACSTAPAVEDTPAPPSSKRQRATESDASGSGSSTSGTSSDESDCAKKSSEESECTKQSCAEKLAVAWKRISSLEAQNEELTALSNGLIEENDDLRLRLRL